MLKMDKPYKILFETVIGSHAWKMNTLDSDLDVFKCYISSTRDILLGAIPKNYFESGDKIDVQTGEIGRVVEGLIKNNFNYLIAVHSPIVRSDCGILNSLRTLSIMNLSKQAYNSIHGLATQNYRKYIEGNPNVSQKHCDTIARSLHFGITLLREGKIVFAPSFGNTPETIKSLLDDLDKAKDESVLPNKAEHTKELEDFLVQIRIKNL